MSDKWKTPIEKAFDEIEVYATRLDGTYRPDDRTVQDGLLLIARVLAYGFKTLVKVIESK